jgi:Holliday junction resolvase RusA-like endonuclease
VADVLSFFVVGAPAPGGSKRVVPRRGKRGGKATLIDDCRRNPAWRHQVASAAALTHRSAPMVGPLEVRFEFVLSRPKGHYGTGRNAGQVRPTAPPYPDVKPDTSKLVRSTEDACTGILFIDDAQIVRQFASKSYGSPPGVRITVRKLAEAFLDA